MAADPAVLAGSLTAACNGPCQVVREVLPSGLALRINIDATTRSNAARFFNHRRLMDR
ncbi:hypothetical protein GPECTOR_14g117 [Gonium pectorale]|uniref:Uncharacterized protein n=1 Tax=Gonium pectorale TaxID=33097 RepID=A0A150GLX8_GONPE|nr:hypothetical protein GPECTOR_14g117 [Gonium pectorale]|eukprot:KXZ50866.1 hypothetical protein GPECTOR_14g117 [Gonium pectorale]